MRLLMGISKNRHGTYYAVKKVPPRLQEAVARVLGKDKARQTWLKRSLKTKDCQQANRIAKPVLMEFDRILAQAEALQVERPLRSELSQREIEQIASFFYAHELAADEENRREGGSEELFQKIAQQLQEAGVEYETPYAIGPVPQFGLSDREMAKIDESLALLLPGAQEALARGNIGYLKWEIDELLKLFRINLDPKSPSYRELGMAVLKAFVGALQIKARRQKGEPIETPPLPAITLSAPSATGASLSTAFEGWKRDGNHSVRTLEDFEYSIRLFSQLHGDLPVGQIRRTHAREFREALRNAPVRWLRKGKLRNATLPELAEWGRENPEAQKIAASTINKLLGGVQAIARWARSEDLVPGDWSDPFADIRIEKDESERAPFELSELRLIFSSPVFSEGARPAGGQGDASFWLPLLAVYTGARMGELAGLRVSDVAHEELVGADCIYVVSDEKAGRRIKTKQSARVIPIHRQLIDTGFMTFVAEQSKARGDKAWLFPKVAPGTTGARAFSKWFMRYLDEHGVTDRTKVFHSFRHNFADALRLAAVGEDVRRALVGHAEGGVHGGYGAKKVAARYRHRLAEAIASVTYTGLDLSHLTNHGVAQSQGDQRGHQ